MSRREEGTYSSRGVNASLSKSCHNKTSSSRSSHNRTALSRSCHGRSTLSKSCHGQEEAIKRMKANSSRYNTSIVEDENKASKLFVVDNDKERLPSHRGQGETSERRRGANHRTHEKRHSDHSKQRSSQREKRGSSSSHHRQQEKHSSDESKNHSEEDVYFSGLYVPNLEDANEDVHADGSDVPNETPQDSNDNNSDTDSDIEDTSSKNVPISSVSRRRREDRHRNKHIQSASTPHRRVKSTSHPSSPARSSTRRVKGDETPRRSKGDETPRRRRTRTASSSSSTTESAIKYPASITVPCDSVCESPSLALAKEKAPVKRRSRGESQKPPSQIEVEEEETMSECEGVSKLGTSIMNKYAVEKKPNTFSDEDLSTTAGTEDEGSCSSSVTAEVEGTPIQINGVLTLVRNDDKSKKANRSNKNLQDLMGVKKYSLRSTGSVRDDASDDSSWVVPVKKVKSLMSNIRLSVATRSANHKLIGSDLDGSFESLPDDILSGGDYNKPCRAA